MTPNGDLWPPARSRFKIIPNPCSALALRTRLTVPSVIVSMPSLSIKRLIGIRPARLVNRLSEYRGFGVKTLEYRKHVQHIDKQKNGWSVYVLADPQSKAHSHRGRSVIVLYDSLHPFIVMKRRGMLYSEDADIERSRHCIMLRRINRYVRRLGVGNT